MSRRLPNSNSSTKRRLFQDEAEDTDDPDDDVERQRRLQQNREGATENFFNQQVEECDHVSQERWNFDFRNETPLKNNDGRWEWDVKVVKLDETDIPKVYLNVLDGTDGRVDAERRSRRNKCVDCSSATSSSSSALQQSTDTNKSQISRNKISPQTLDDTPSSSNSKIVPEKIRSESSLADDTDSGHQSAQPETNASLLDSVNLVEHKEDITM